MVLDYRSLVRNAGTAFLAQGVAMTLSIVQTLLVPKLLGVTQYGYWQLFLFYCSYVGLAHLGLDDGVYLIKGGESRNRIDKSSVISQFWFGVCFQSVIAAGMILLAMQGSDSSDRTYIIIFTAVYLVVHNASLFLMYTLQAMNETKKSSYATIVERLTFFVPLVIYIILRCDTYKLFIIAYVAASLVQLGYCLWCCKDFTKKELYPLPVTIRQSIQSIRVGFKLMMANLASQLVLGVARFAIDLQWGIETFGQLSLALSMVNFFLAFISQASMVLFPALRQSNSVELKKFFNNSRDILSLITPSFYILYFPLVGLLGMWLPAYANSLLYFVFLIPICVFDCKMNICCTTYFKVLRQELRLLKINLWTCAASALFTFLGVVVFQSIYIVIAGITISIIGRSLWSEEKLSKDLDIHIERLLEIGELGLTALFMIVALTLPSLSALIIYVIFYIMYLLILINKVATINNIIKR